MLSLSGRMAEKEPTGSTEIKNSGSFMPNRRSFLKMASVAGGAALTSGTAAAQSAENVLADLELPDPDDRPLMRVLSTGGTIASTEAAADEGYSLSEQADAIIESVPQLKHFVEIEIEEIAQVGSPSLLVEDFVEIAKAAKRAEEDGAAGAIVTHGTNTIEEDAYFNDLVLDLDIPVVFVGAMRPADAIVADGPMNLLLAARLITREEFHLTDEPSGVYALLNETVHAARDIMKSDTWSLETFTSATPGPIARFTDDEFLLYREPGSYSADLSDCDLDAAPEMNVPIVATGAGAEAPLMEQAATGEYDADGFAVQHSGRGGTSPAISEATDTVLEAGIPVVSSSRNFDGPASRSDDPGSWISMEDLPVWKARLFLMAALTMTNDLEELREIADGDKYGTRIVPTSTL
jgi:L-asparaginase